MRIDMSAFTQPLNIGKKSPSQPVERQETDRGALKEEIRSAQSGIRVSLSAMSKANAKQSKKDEDIDQSGLPDSIKGQLKTIRRIKEQIEEKQQEMRALAADSRLDPKERAERLARIQSELSSLSSALSEANSGLLKAMKEQKLGKEQVQVAMGLLMK